MVVIGQFDVVNPKSGLEQKVARLTDALYAKELIKVSAVDRDGCLPLCVTDNAGIFVGDAVEMHCDCGEILRFEHGPIEGQVACHGIAEEIDALRVDRGEVPGVVDYAAEDAGRCVFELGVAGQIGSQEDDLLFPGQTFPGVDHLRRPVSRTVEEHHDRERMVLSGEYSR